jgi:hypothetical protein
MKSLIVVYVLTYGGAVVSLFNPFAGLLVYVAFALLRPAQTFFWGVPPGDYSRTVAICLLIGWVLQGFGDWRFGRARGIVIALVCFWIWAILAATRATDQELAWNYVESLTKIVLPFIVGITTIDSVKKLKQLAWVIVLSIGYRAYIENEIYYKYGIVDRDNMIAHTMVLGAGAGLFLSIHTQGWWRKLAALASAVLSAHVPLIHESRGAIMGLLTTSTAGFLVMRKKPVHCLVFVLALAAGLRLAGPNTRARFLTTFAGEGERDSSAQSRFDLQQALSKAIGQQPILGIGPAHWHLVSDTYGFPSGKEGHNLWLQLGAEIGVPGLVFLLTFYGLAVTRLWPIGRGKHWLPDPWFQCIGCMVVASVCGFIVEAWVASFLFMEEPYYITLLGAGALKLLSRPEQIVPTTDASPR